MSAEGKPQTPNSPGEKGSLVGQPLKLLTVLVARFPISVIVISALLVALSLTGTQLSLGFRTSRSDLLNPKSENNRRWAEFTQEFGEQDDVTVVVKSEDPQAVPPILDELAAQLARQPKMFRSIFHKIDVARLKSKGLYNDQVSPQFLQQINGFLNQSQGLLRRDYSSLNVGGQIAWFAEQIDRGDPRLLAAGQGQQSSGGQYAGGARVLRVPGDPRRGPQRGTRYSGSRAVQGAQYAGSPFPEISALLSRAR